MAEDQRQRDYRLQSVSTTDSYWTVVNGGEGYDVHPCAYPQHQMQQSVQPTGRYPTTIRGASAQGYNGGFQEVVWSNQKLCNLPQLYTQQLAAGPPINSIVLDHNAFTDIPEELLPYTNSLLFLSLCNQRPPGIAQLSDKLVYFTQLVKLKLAQNKLARLPRSIANLSEMVMLDLSANSFSTFPDEVVHFPKLEYLNLSHNYLEHIPAGICNLKHLRVLMLDSNRLRGFPEGLCELQALEKVSLRENLIQHVPTSSICVVERLALQEERLGPGSGLMLHNNPLDFPPRQLCDRGTRVILDFMKAYCRNWLPSVGGPTNTSPVAPPLSQRPAHATASVPAVSPHHRNQLADHPPSWAPGHQAGTVGGRVPGHIGNRPMLRPHTHQAAGSSLASPHGPTTIITTAEIHPHPPHPPRTNTDPRSGPSASPTASISPLIFTDAFLNELTRHVSSVAVSLLSSLHYRPPPCISIDQLRSGDEHAVRQLLIHWRDSNTLGEMDMAWKLIVALRVVNRAQAADLIIARVRECGIDFVEEATYDNNFLGGKRTQ